MRNKMFKRKIQFFKFIMFLIKQQKTLVHEGELLTRERLCCGLSIFEYVLMKTKSILLESKLNGQVDYNSSQIYQASSSNLANDDNIEFHKMWSAFQFVYCMPKQGSAYLVE